MKKLQCFSVTLPTLLLAAGTAVSQTYHPLDLGLEWSYETQSGVTQLMTISGERDVFGVTTRVRLQEESEQTFENYWTMDSSGNLFLHGAFNYDAEFEAAYVPPIQMVAAPLFEGKQWVTEDVEVFTLDGVSWGGDPFDYPVRVYSEGDVEVPLGPFYTYGVGFDIDPLLEGPDGSTYDLFGRKVDADGQSGYDNSTEWYSEDIGLVQSWFSVGDPFRLVSFNGAPVPVVEMSWGQVRWTFR